MFVVSSYSQLEEAARDGVGEILICGKLAESLLQRFDCAPSGNDQRQTFEVGTIEYEALSRSMNMETQHLLLCRCH